MQAREDGLPDDNDYVLYLEELVLEHAYKLKKLIPQRKGEDKGLYADRVMEMFLNSPDIVISNLNKLKKRFIFKTRH